MINQNKVLSILSQFQNVSNSQYDIKEIGIFGSLARGDNNNDSDVDIVVKLVRQDMFNLIGIQQDLEEALHTKVDVVSYRENMNSFLKKRIDEEAIYV